MTAPTIAQSNLHSQQDDTLEPQSFGDRQMIAILDFGSQYSELIARRIRETKVYSEVLSYSTSAEQLAQLKPRGIILSGGPNSVYDPHPPLCDPAIWDLGIPILGVCYGMQLMVQVLGGGLWNPLKSPSTVVLSCRLSIRPTC